MFSVETSRLPAGHWLANRRLTATEVNLASDLMNRDSLGKKQRSGPGRVHRLSIRRSTKHGPRHGPTIYGPT